MHSLQFTAESSSHGMLERDFAVGGVPGVQWSPSSHAAGRAPVIPMGHGDGLALFDGFASKEKPLHVNSGRHKELPRFEVDSAVRFFARHFGGAVTTPA